MTPEVDGKKATVGGLVSTVRTIITKSGTKMAFVGIEDKTGEGEIIVFPNLYEQVGAKLITDEVIRVTGKISARDRDGNLGTDAKMIADDIQAVTDLELRTYESTGRHMEKPKVSGKVKATRVASNRPSKYNSVSAPASTPPKKASSPSEPQPRPMAEAKLQKLYVHIKDPDDQKALLALKQECGRFIGPVDIVLVLGATKKSAIKLPFRVDGSQELISSLVKILGEDAVVLK